MMPAFEYARPSTVGRAVAELSGARARILAGGTDLLGCLRDGVFRPEKLVSLGDLAELRGITDTAAGGLRIGGMTPLAEIAEHPRVARAYPALADAAASVGSPQIRNQGTLGGNLCQRPRCWFFRGGFECLRRGGAGCSAVDGPNELHGILGSHNCHAVHPSDTAPALVALEAQARIAGPGGSRQLPLEDFFVLPEQDVTRETILEEGELLTEIILPPAPAAMKSRYRKIRERQSFDFALVGAAVALRVQQGVVERARVVLSGVAMKPWRAVDAERILAGSAPNRERAAAAAAASVVGAEPLARNGVKVELARKLVEELLVELSA